MREEDILPYEDGKDKEESPGKHEEHQNRKDDGEEERKGGMDVLQSHHRDIPEQKDEREEDQTGENQKPDEDSLLGFNLQNNPPTLLRNADCRMRHPLPNPPPSRGRERVGGIRNLLIKDCSHGDRVSGKKFTNSHSPPPL